MSPQKSRTKGCIIKPESLRRGKILYLGLLYLGLERVEAGVLIWETGTMRAKPIPGKLGRRG